jgi:hypothetical protein
MVQAYELAILRLTGLSGSSGLGDPKKLAGSLPDPRLMMPSRSWYI